MAKIFVSYSRKDIEFARRLTDELQKNDLDFWVDWEGIPPTVDWWQQIEKGIEEADVFLFLISPDSASSKICAQEIDCAVKNGKRLIPLVVRDIKGEDAPAQLGHINWIFFRKNDDFEASTAKLLTAIQTDYEWAQTHRRLQVKALEWERNNHEKSFLLRGKDLQDAELQLATNTSKEPHPTDLQRDYVLQSRQAADRQRRITAAISGAGIIALAVLAVFAFIQAGAARIAQAEAEKQAQAAIAAQERAEQEQAKAEAAQLHAEAETRIATSGRLALESENSLAQYPQRALLLALEAVKVNEDANEPVRPDAEEALRLALKKVTGIGLTGFNHEVNLIQFTNDNKWLVAGTNTINGEIKIWDVEKATNDPTYQPYYLSFPVDTNQDFILSGYWLPAIGISPQTEWLVLASSTETKLYLIADEDEVREPLTFSGKIEFTNLKDDNFILENQGDKVVYWQIDPQTLAKEELAAFDGGFVSLSDDRTFLITDDPAQGLLLWNFSTLSSEPILLTEKHASDFIYSRISPTNEWLILFENHARPEYQVPKYDEQYVQIGTQDWNSTDIVLIPLTQTKKQEFRIELNFAEDPYTDPKFSEDGKSLVYRGANPPNQFGNATGSSIGVLSFAGLEFNNLTASSNSAGYSQVSFIKNDWLYIEEFNYITNESLGKFFDLRENDLFVNGETSFLLLLDENGNAKLSEDGNYLFTQSGDLLNFHQLDFNQAISIEPASQLPSTQTYNPLEFAVNNTPRDLGLEDRATKITQSMDGAWLAAGGYDGSIRMWNNLTPYIDSNMQLPAYGNYISFSNDNQWMAINGTIWKLENGKPVKAYPFDETINDSGYGPYSPVSLGVFSPNSRWMIYLNYDGEDFDTNVHLLDLTTLVEEDEIKDIKINEVNSVYSTVQFSQDSNWVLIGDDLAFGTVSNDTYPDGPQSFIYNIENKKHYSLPQQTTSFAFSEDQNHIFLMLAEKQDYSLIWQKVEAWSLPLQGNPDLEKIGELPITDFPVVSQNGRWMLTTSYTTSDTNLWDLNCLIEKTECKSFAIQTTLASFSPNSQYMLTAYNESGDWTQPTTHNVWSLQNNQPEEIHNFSAQQTFPSISKDGNLILFTPMPTNFYSMSFVHTAGHFSSWSGYNGIGANVTTFDGYGHVFIGGGGGGGNTFGGYEGDYAVSSLTTTDKTIIRLRGHESNISISQVSPNENFVLTYSGMQQNDGGEAEKLLRLWQLDKMRLDPAIKPIVLPLTLGPTGDISALAFNPTSEYVYVVDNKNVLHYFPIAIKELQEQACIAIGRNLSISEWERFFPNTAYRKTCENLPEHPSAISQ